MSKKSYIILIGFCFSSTSWAVLNEGTPPMPSFSQGQGALSYTFFNLSGQSCTLVPKGAGANPAAYSSWGQSNGWINSGDYDAPGMFNPDGIPFVVGMNANYTYYEAKSGTSDYYTSSYSFYDWPDSPIVSVPGQQPLANGGTPVSEMLLSSAVNTPSWNTPAMGDSWYITCTSSSSTTAEIAIASFASTQNALVSGNTSFSVYNSAARSWYLSSNYWYPAYPGWFANADINPVAEGNPNGNSQPCYGGPSPEVYSCSYTGGSMCLSNQGDYTNPAGSPSDWLNNPNPCGAGFTASSAQTGSQIFNWNPANNNNQGGLWSGINYANYSAFSPYPAVLNVNMPMLPVNLAAYVQTNSNNPAQLYPAVYWTPIMGGHYTYAIGDPFLVSSFAAKILAYLATSQNAQLNNASDLASVSYSLTSGNGSAPIFPAGSTASDYVQWLMGSQSSSQNYLGAAQLAANAFKQTYNAAANNSTKTESIWGKIFQVLADTAILTIAAGINEIPGGDVATAIVSGATAEGAGEAISQLNSTIANAYTTTTDPTTPLSTTAPAVVNPTYSSSNLLGLLLTNSGVQAAINSTMGWTSNPSPLLSNYSVYIDQYCIDNDINTLGLEANLLSGTCISTASGATSAVNGPTPSGSNPPAYQNVYAGVTTTASTTQPTPISTTQLSIWTAILTGSDITVNEDGWLVLGDSANGNAPFQPPMQLYSTITPSTLSSYGVTNPSLNTTFNPNTFTVTAHSVEWVPSSGSCPSSAPALNGATTTTCEYVLQNAATLNYMKCVNDQNATGGIIATFAGNGTTLAGTEVVLACACIPSYIGGGASSGLDTGASSVNPGLSCP